MGHEGLEYVGIAFLFFYLQRCQRDTAKSDGKHRMTDRNWRPDIEVHDIGTAFSLLTRLPVPVDHTRAGERAASAVWAYPLVGAALGLMAGVFGTIALMLGASETIAAALALGALAVLTGAMHEDGLADCADGLGGSPDKSRALEIMKDSRIGAFGAVALGIALIARWSGILELTFHSLVFPLMVVGAVSRLPMVLAMHFMPHARETGLSKTAGIPPIQAVVLAIVVATVLAIMGMGLAGVLVLGWACIAALPMLLYAQFRLNGQTGDVLGGAQQCAEVIALASAVAILA